MNIRQVLESENDPDKLLGDILRVLAVYRKLWVSEIVSEIASLRKTLGEEEVGEKQVREALYKLMSKNIVVGDRRTRTTFRGSVEEYLVELNITPDLANLINKDERLRKYLTEKYNALKQLGEK
ncbi:hypothetical protein [Staphylothermus hellenicus]|uniref:Uncharacterized protein n=1 Tax=Staphylothermus hellenicus (strain DSM 12710 / JCM 10830 / BK20S6-10-b1 / P8) TaxID=591019 RepID=D7DB23_STAHD|nr:hypothetical protein [Staphylothermus hellenicus]ADI31370.1 hypothetical protein Shell_0231 [Staphylothermus hellenicus DSM 12710]